MSKYLGLLFGDLLDDYEAEWEVAKTEIVFLEIVDNQIIIALESLIDAHHALYQKVYKTFLKPKHYFMTNYLYRF